VGAVTEREKMESYHDKLATRPDHPCCSSPLEFCEGQSEK